MKDNSIAIDEIVIRNTKRVLNAAPNAGGS